MTDIPAAVQRRMANRKDARAKRYVISDRITAWSVSWSEVNVMRGGNTQENTHRQWVAYIDGQYADSGRTRADVVQVAQHIPDLYGGPQPD